MRVLVVDDDKEIAHLLARDLHAHGYTVDTVGLAEHALVAAVDTDYALMVVDLGLPDGDGLDLVRQIRERGNHTPILVVTARRRVEDRVVGLASGADDYLVKPFALPELRARVMALLRRPAFLDRTRSTVANIVVDREAMEAIVEGVGIGLTRKQFALLELLVRRKGHITPKRMIEETLYGFDDRVSANSIEAHVYKLRLALRAACADVAIETRRGIGYRLLEAAPSGRRATATPRIVEVAPIGVAPDERARLDPDGRFLQRLSDDRSALAAQRRKIADGDDAALAAVQARSHRLAGAAGTFGYDRIGAAAAALDQDAEAALAAAEVERRELLSLVGPGLDRLIALVDAVLEDERQRA